MEKFSLIDFGSIGEPAAGVINNFVNKISNALGWVVMPKNVKPAIIEANKSFIEEIACRKDIHPLERAAIVNNYKKIVKEYKNQVDIVQMAVEHLTPDCRPECVSDDWITFFFDKIKNITEDNIKIILAKILAEECNNDKKIPKQLINVLSLMEKNDILTFNKVCNMSIKDNMNNEKVFFINNEHILQEFGINYMDLMSLESLGLIECPDVSNYSYVIKIKDFCERVKETGILGIEYILTYGDVNIKVDILDSIPIGNMKLTLIGELLKTFLTVKPIKGYEKYIVDYLKNKVGNAEIINI